MLKVALSFSVVLHGVIFTMLYFCPEGWQVGAIKGGDSSVAVEFMPTSQSESNPSPSLTKRMTSVKKVTPEKKLVRVIKASPKAIENTVPRKTLLTSTAGMGEGFDLRNLKSNLTPAMQKFFYQLRMDIEKNKRYPKKAKRFRHRGEVAVKFAISKQGKISNVQLEKPSPYETLNQSAQNTVNSILSNNYPLPAEVSASQIQVILPIRYSL